MKRRSAVASACTFPWVLAASAQSTIKRLGWLATATAAASDPLRKSIAARLEARGWRVGHDLVIASRHGNNSLQALPEAARELLAEQPDVIVAIGTPCVVALQRLTRTVPIVMWYASVPQQLGLVASLARRGANMTGATGNQPEMSGKLLETLRLADPRVARVAILRNPENLGITHYSPFAAKTARQLEMELHYFELRRPEDLRLEDVERVKPHALYIVNDFVVSPLVPVLLQFALERGIASIGVDRSFARAGGLLALGPDLDEMETTVVEYVDRILRGASPAVMPVREPSRYWLVVNRRTARAIGLDLAHEILVSAKEIVD